MSGDPDITRISNEDEFVNIIKYPTLYIWSYSGDLDIAVPHKTLDELIRFANNKPNTVGTLSWVFYSFDSDDGDPEEYMDKVLEPGLIEIPSDATASHTIENDGYIKIVADADDEGDVHYSFVTQDKFDVTNYDVLRVLWGKIVGGMNNYMFFGLTETPNAWYLDWDAFKMAEAANFDVWDKGWDPLDISDMEGEYHLGWGLRIPEEKNGEGHFWTLNLVEEL